MDEDIKIVIGNGRNSEVDLIGIVIEKEGKGRILKRGDIGKIERKVKRVMKSLEIERSNKIERIDERIGRREIIMRRGKDRKILIGKKERRGDIIGKRMYMEEDKEEIEGKIIDEMVKEMIGGGGRNWKRNEKDEERWREDGGVDEDELEGKVERRKKGIEIVKGGINMDEIVIGEWEDV